MLVYQNFIWEMYKSLNIRMFILSYDFIFSDM